MLVFSIRLRFRFNKFIEGFEQLRGLRIAIFASFFKIISIYSCHKFLGNSFRRVFRTRSKH